MTKRNKVIRLSNEESLLVNWFRDNDTEEIYKELTTLLEGNNGEAPAVEQLRDFVSNIFDVSLVKLANNGVMDKKTLAEIKEAIESRKNLIIVGKDNELNEMVLKALLNELDVLEHKFVVPTGYIEKKYVIKFKNILKETDLTLNEIVDINLKNINREAVLATGLYDSYDLGLLYYLLLNFDRVIATVRVSNSRVLLDDLKFVNKEIESKLVRLLNDEDTVILKADNICGSLSLNIMTDIRF